MDMETVNMHKAKTELSRLVQDVQDGKKVCIARRGKPVVELKPIEDHTLRVPGLLKGKILISDDFDKPIEDLNVLFEGDIDPDESGKGNP